MGRTTWKEIILSVNANRIHYALDAKGKGKGDIMMVDVISVKETVIEGKANCFALVGTKGFFPFQCKDRLEMEGWIKCIRNNIERLRLLNQIAKLSLK